MREQQQHLPNLEWGRPSPPATRDAAGVNGSPLIAATPSTGRNRICRRRAENRKSRLPGRISAIPQARLASGWPWITLATANPLKAIIQYGRPPISSRRARPNHGRIQGGHRAQMPAAANASAAEMRLRGRRPSTTRPKPPARYAGWCPTRAGRSMSVQLAGSAAAPPGAAQPPAGAAGR